MAPSIAVSPRSVLILWIGRLGDFIVSTPVLEALRKKFPEARLTLLTGPRAAPLARLDPNVNEVLVLQGFHRPFDNLALAARVASGFDLAVDLNPSASRSSAFLLLLSRASVRVSFEKPWARRLATHTLPHDPDREHFMDRYGRLAEAFGAPFQPRLRVYPRPEDFAAADLTLRSLRLDPARPWVGIHAGNFAKFDHRWPEENFRALTLRLLERRDLQLLYLAGPGEEAPLARLLAGLPPLKALSPQPLPVSAAALARLDLLIGSCSGPIHLAAAVGTPTFSFNSRYTLSCWQPRGHIGVASEAWGSCRDISVDQAWEKLQPLLSGLKPSRRAAGS